jgi:hypothetical protein
MILKKKFREQGNGLDKLLILDANPPIFLTKNCRYADSGEIAQ